MNSVKGNAVTKRIKLFLFFFMVAVWSVFSTRVPSEIIIEWQKSARKNKDEVLEWDGKKLFLLLSLYAFLIVFGFVIYGATA